MERAPVNSEPFRHLLANLRCRFDRSQIGWKDRLSQSALAWLPGSLFMDQVDQSAQLLGTG